MAKIYVIYAGRHRMEQLNHFIEHKLRPIYSNLVMQPTTSTQQQSTAENQQLVEPVSDQQNYDSSHFRQEILKADVVLVFYDRDMPSHLISMTEFDFADRHHKPVIVVYLQDYRNGGNDGGLLSTLLTNAADSLAFFETSDVEEVSRELQTKVERLMETGRYQLTNGPEIAGAKYFPRPKEVFENLRSKLRELSSRPSDGVLVVAGPEGVGKTTLVAEALKTSPHGSVKTTFWFNCYKWHKGGVYSHSTDQATLQKHFKLSLLDKLHAHGKTFSSINQPDLYVFDEVSRIAWIEMFHKMFTDNEVPVCVIVTTKQLATFKLEPKFQTLLNRHHDSLVDIPLFSDQELVSFAKWSCPGIDKKLSQAQMRELSQRAGGLPKRVVDFLEHFKEINPRTGSHNDYDKAIAQLLGHIHPEMKHLPRNNGNRQQHSTKTAEVMLSPRAISREKSAIPVHIGSAEKKFPELILCNVPDFELYYLIKEHELAILSLIHQTSKDPISEGPLLVLGRPGIGKTSLVAATLCNLDYEHYFVRNCNVQLVVWVNANTNFWKTEAQMIEAILQHLTKEQRIAGSADLDVQSLSGMLDHFEKVERRRVLLVFDDVNDALLVQNVRKGCETTPCVILSNTLDQKDFELLNPSFRFKTFSMPGFTEEQLVEMFESNHDLRDKLAPFQLHKMAQRFCYGSPLIARLVIGQLHRTRRFAKKLEDVFNKFSYWRSEQDLANQLIRSLFQSIYVEKSRFYFMTLLLFDPDEAADVTLDLAVLWNLPPEEASELADYFYDLALVTRSTERSAKTGHYFTKIYLHKAVHEAVFGHTLELFQEQSLCQLRLKLLIELQKDSSIAQLAFRLVENKRYEFLCVILQKILKADFPEGISTKCPVPECYFDEQNRTSLMAAAQVGHMPMLRHLYEAHKSSLASLDANGLSALAYALINGHLDCANFLYKLWPQAMDLKDKKGANIFERVVEKVTEIRQLEYILETSPESLRHLNPNGQTALMAAARAGNQPAVEFLYRKWPEAVSILDKHGRSALHWACEKCRSLGVVVFLANAWLESVKIVDTENDETALMLAANAGNLQIVRFLTETYPDGIALESKNGKTALALATARGHLEVVKYLHDKWIEIAHDGGSHGNAAINSEMANGLLNGQ